jgi:hypothetical protein
MHYWEHRAAGNEMSMSMPNSSLLRWLRHSIIRGYLHHHIQDPQSSPASASLIHPQRYAGSYPLRPKSLHRAYAVTSRTSLPFMNSTHRFRTPSTIAGRILFHPPYIWTTKEASYDHRNELQTLNITFLPPAFLPIRHPQDFCQLPSHCGSPNRLWQYRRMHYDRENALNYRRVRVSAYMLDSIPSTLLSNSHIISIFSKMSYKLAHSRQC